MYKCKCGREFENKQSYCAHCRHCKIHLGKDPIYSISPEGRKAMGWNRGLTAKTDKRLFKYGETYKNNIALGKITPSWKGRKHTDEQKRKIGESVSKNYNYNCNRRSGRGKKGWYKGFYCSSSYELAYVIYCLDHNIPIKRYKGYFSYKRKDGSIHRYYPDFEVDDTIIEIKGFNNSDTLLKRDAVINSGNKYKLLYYKDLLDVFDYIEKKYNKSVDINIFDLYDKI